MAQSITILPNAADSRPLRRQRPRRGRPSKLFGLRQDTPELYAQVLALIRHGAFAHVAAEYVGVAPETFSRWMSRGANPCGHRIYRQFRQDVTQAAAQARVSAEMRVYREDPVAWLRFGPGRSMPGRPGWTNPRSQPQVPATVNSVPSTSVLAPVQADLRATLTLLEQLGQVVILPMGHAMFDVPQGDGVET